MDVTSVDVVGKAQLVSWAPNDRILWCRSDTTLWTGTVAGGAHQIATGCLPSSAIAQSGTGTILFAPSDHRELMAINEGGSTARVTVLDEAHGEIRHVYPSFLPDGTHFVFLVFGSDLGQVGIYLGALGSETRTRLVEASSRPVVIARPDGNADLMFLQRGSLIVQRIDVAAGRLTGDPRVITDQIGLGLTSFTGAYSASDRLIAYRRGGQGADGHQLTWFDRSGRPGETIDAGLGLITSFSLTRDERMLLVGKFTRANTISEWLYDLTRHASQQILHDANERISFDGGAWAPDEKTFIYASAEAGRWMIYERQIDGQHDRPVIAGTVMQYPRPLQLVAYLSTGQWALVNTIDKSASVLPVENGVTNQPRLSPDGRVLAYTVNQIAGPDVFLQPYPNGRRVAVSVGGGLDPEWSADGKELFYLTPDGWVMSVTIGHDTVPTVSQPARLFQIPLPNRERLQPLTIGRSRFQPGAHGRFLVSLPLSPPGSVTVRTAW